MSEQIIPVEAEFTLLRKDLGAVRRRGAIRYRTALATLGKLLFPETGESREAWINNLSETGVGLSLATCLEAGTPIVLLLRLPNDKTLVRLPGRVAHSTRELDGSWRVGCEFDDRLSSEQLDALLG